MLKAGLFPYNPEVVIQQLPPPLLPPENSASCPTTPRNMTAPLSFSTPANMGDLNGIMREIKAGSLPDPMLFAEKVCKAAAKAMAELYTLKAINIDLVEASKAKEKRKNWESGNNSKARVLDCSELQRRQQFAANKAWEAITKEFNGLSPDILNPPVARVRPSLEKRAQAARDRAFNAAVKPLLRLGPELFASTPPVNEKKMINEKVGQARKGPKSNSKTGLGTKATTRTTKAALTRLSKRGT